MDNDVREYILQKEYRQCFRCGSVENPQWHHGVVTDEKSRRKKLQCRENGVRLCKKCNVDNKGAVENHRFRNLVFNYKLRLGYDMFFWYSSLKYRTPERFYMMSDKEFRSELKELTWRE